MSKIKVSVIIPAAGDANRMHGVNKQLYLLDDKPVVEHCLHAFSDIPAVGEIIVVCREQELSLYKELAAHFETSKLSTAAVVGGATRQQSVFSGINASKISPDFYAIHDGARPLIRKEEIRGCLALAEKYGAAAVGVPVKDTIKIVDTSGKIISTPPRENTYAIQTPQIFDASLYQLAMAQALQEEKTYTDDCQLVEQLGEAVYVYSGSYDNIKITTPEDLPLVEDLYQRLKGK